ncbi:MAG: A/G-specific adenine glycosylase [Phycisphaerales bacterium]|nr:A/G-specific adenine glycosylase [Phycisphaerales bacterium]MCB9856520.1 A/G-specific adenine glycosylase [Phycisphaerales bacterium]MCB9864001.1 A/G-specific adenine glycosylase [Phycisphaerales bacterium]
MPPSRPSNSRQPARPIKARTLADIRRKLLAWYRRNRRNLPWRNTSDPYAIWLSETMLQQTQVATVIPYYERFLRKYPSIERLAGAPLDEVLNLWAGLGYYSRARNLHRAAIEITNRYNGRVPDSTAELRTLPGVGRYTAGAVASIAYDVRTAVVDGNVSRVIARLFDIHADVKSPAGEKTVWNTAEVLLPRKHVGDFNQALMELGATVCRPGDAAECDACPLRNECNALAAGNVARLPVRKKKTPVKKETHIAIVADFDNKRLYRRRPAEGLWGGLWELPSVVRNGAAEHATAQMLARELLGDSTTVDRRQLCTIEHQLTHRSVKFVAFRAHATTSRLQPDSQESSRWLTKHAADRIGLSTAMRKIIAAIPETTPDSNGRAPTKRQ